MKGVGSKAISSPSRGAAAENYPPPLIMRFLRSNVGSKSRGARSRSSPMFVVRKKNAAAAIETQEPSSPKVTCIGQVRVRRSKNFTPSKPGRSQGTCTCFSVTKCSICSPRKPNLRKWASFLQFGCCKKVDVIDNLSKLKSNERNHFNDGETEVNGNEDEEAQIKEKEDSEEVLRGTTPPPKNALLLTRCRSTPFRSSSLAVQFWGETNNAIGDEVKMASCCDFDQRENESGKQTSIKLQIDEEESEQICTIGKQLERDLSIGKNMEQVDMPHPLLLTRCKSESASKTGEKQAKGWLM